MDIKLILVFLMLHFKITTRHMNPDILLCFVVLWSERASDHTYSGTFVFTMKKRNCNRFSKIKQTAKGRSYKTLKESNCFHSFAKPRAFAQRVHNKPKMLLNFCTTQKADINQNTLGLCTHFLQHLRAPGATQK